MSIPREDDAPVKEPQEERVEQEPCNVVFTHTNADFDSLAAAVALSLLWSQQPPSSEKMPTHVVLPRGVHPVVQRFLAFHKHLLPLRGFKTILPEDVHAIGVVDAQNSRRIGRGKAWLDKARSIHVFDHHQDDTEEDVDPTSLVNLATELVIDQVGSTTTLLVERLREANIKPAPAEATLFVLGIRADTGGLVYEGTTIRDASAMLWCLENGASQAAISEFGVARISEQQRHVLNAALQHTNTHVTNGLRVSSVLIPDNQDSGYVAGLAHVCEELLDLTDSDVFLFGATHTSSGDKKNKGEQTEWVSLIGRASPRSVGVDLNVVMRTFGGGGHPKAAAAAVRCEPETPAAHILQSAVDICDSQIPEQLLASSFMVPLKQCITIGTTDTVASARQLFDEHGLKSAPVVDGDDHKTHKGSLKLSDLVNAKRKGRGNDKVKSIMRSKVTTVLPDTPLAELEEFLVHKGVGRLPVVDDDGALLGIVTRTDVLRQHNMYNEDDLDKKR